MKRFAEPSTWAGIAVLFQCIKAVLPGHNQVYADALSAAAAALAGALPERQKAA
ncbi:MAG: hypothetical protein WCC39_13270 [Telluria sp.]